MTPSGLDPTWVFYQIERPRVNGFLELPPVVPAFVKQARSAARKPGFGEFEEIGKRRYGPGRDEVRGRHDRRVTH